MSDIMTDYSSEIYSVLSNIMNFWYLIPIVLLSIFFKTSFGKDVFGKFFVNFMINLKLNRKKYHLLKNITLKTEEGTTQIDHIIVSQYGIFIIKTKNIKGSIFGEVDKKIWTQKIYDHSVKFQNPLDQNSKHTKIIESLLEIDKNKIFSIVTFVGDNTFKTKMPKNVTYLGGFINFINSKTNKLFSKKEVEIFISMIKNG